MILFSHICILFLATALALAGLFCVDEFKNKLEYANHANRNMWRYSHIVRARRQALLALAVAFLLFMSAFALVANLG